MDATCLLAWSDKGIQSCKLQFGSRETTAPALLLLNYSEFAAVRGQFAMMAASATGLLWNTLLIVCIVVINFVSGTDKGRSLRYKGTPLVKMACFVRLV